MKKRTKKFSLGMKIAGILACLALVSVGFASWLIVQVTDPAPLEDGSFTVYSVDTKNVKIENTAFADVTPARDPAVSSSSIIFGKDASATPDWLIAGSDVQEENLTATLTFDVNLYDNTNTLSSDGKIQDYITDVKLNFVPAGIDDAIEAGYITAPVITYSYEDADSDEHTDTVTYDPDADAADLSISMAEADANTVEVTVTIAFGWGEAFGGENPYVYFNTKTPNDPSTVLKPDSETEYLTWAEYADTALTGLNAISSGAHNYTITLTAQIKK